MEREKSLNTFSIVAFILSFLLAPVGLILSIIGVVRCRKFEKEEGAKAKYKVFNIVGIVVSALITISSLFTIGIILLAYTIAVSNDSDVLGSYTCSSKYSSTPMISATFKDGKFTWAKYNSTNNSIEGTYIVKSRQLNNGDYTYKLRLRPTSYNLSGYTNIKTKSAYNIVIEKTNYKTTITFENGSTYNCYKTTGTKNEF